MRLRELKNGVQICPEITLDSLLYTHNSIALYLASDTDSGHTLVHLLPDIEDASLEVLQKVVEFYKDNLKLETRCGRFEEFLYFSEPFPLGEYMFEWLERRERVALPEALKRIISLLKILQQAHEKDIYNGRITPQSVLLERSGVAFGLRMMGLGVAQALPPSLRYDIDWFDYTFDLEGMSPVAVDIYGIAIILMGLVSGESGIDSFEATGLLPQSLRGGILQQAMERALALRIDAYPTILAFSLDLEAALLEIDDRQGEVYVGDLVGFESAIKSISSIHEEKPENSGVWSSMFETLEQNERSSLLCSLTSLTAIPALGPEDDDDITKVTTLPQALVGMQRIKSAHQHEDECKTDILAAPMALQDEVDNSSAEAAEVDNSSAEAAPEEQAPAQPDKPEDKFASIKNLEAELQSDDEEDDAPTRVMMRPNYATISFGQTGQGVNSSIEEVIKNSSSERATVTTMLDRIQQATVIEFECELKHDIQYDPNDPVAFPPEDESQDSQSDDSPNSSLVRNAAEAKSKTKTGKSPNINAPQKADVVAHTSTHFKAPSKFSKGQKFLLIFLIIVVIALGIAMAMHYYHLI